MVAAREEATTRATTQAVPQVSAADADASTVSAAPGGIVGGPEDSELVRRRWPEVLGTLERRRVTWALVSANSQVASVEAGVLTLSFENGAIADRFRGGQHAENVALAVRETLGLTVRVDATVGPASASPASAATSPTASAAPQTASVSRVAASEPPLPTEEPPDEHEISADDAPAPAAQLSGADVIASMLGGTIVED